MKKLINILGLIVMILLLSNCDQVEETQKEEEQLPKGFDYGKTEKNIYSNSFFNFKIDLPKGWIIQTQEQTDQLSEDGRDLIAGDDEEMKDFLDASDIESANLLSVFQFEFDAEYEYNPSIAIVAENVQAAPGIKDGNDYLHQMKLILQQGEFQYDYMDETFEAENINGTEFYTMKSEIIFEGMVIKQKFYSTVLKGFSFGVVISYVGEDQKSDLLKSINSMKFGD